MPVEVTVCRMRQYGNGLQSERGGYAGKRQPLGLCANGMETTCTSRVASTCKRLCRVISSPRAFGRCGDAGNGTIPKTRFCAVNRWGDYHRGNCEAH